METRFTRWNAWLLTRVWIPVMALVASVVLLGFALLMITIRVDNASSKLTELRYRSCIEDAVLDFKIAEGDLVAAAFSRDAAGLAAAKPGYDASLLRLKAAQHDCRKRYPE